MIAAMRTAAMKLFASGLKDWRSGESEATEQALNYLYGYD
jgi:hypothetical protein